MWFSPEEAAILDLRAGDLVVCEGGDVGRCAWLESDLEGFGFQNSVNRVRAQSNQSTRYLAYWLSCIKTTGFIDVLCNRSTIAHYTAEKLGATPLPIPPAAEQITIATFLDRETGKIDALVAEQERLIALLKEKRQAVISQAVTKGLNPDAPMKPSGVEWLGEIPAHWVVKRLKHISPFVTVGVVVNPSMFVSEDGYPFIYGGDIREGLIDWGNSRRIDAASSEVHAKTRLNARDLLTVRVGAPGVTAVVPAECEGGNCASVMLTRRGQFNSDWLCYVMNTRVVRFQVEVVQYGAAQEQFNISHAVDFLVPTPPRIEQESIAKSLAVETATLDALVAEATRAITLLRERRAALISAAVTGKIDVRDAVHPTTELAAAA